jgi:ammonium transporter, Amt family
VFHPMLRRVLPLASLLFLLAVPSWAQDTAPAAPGATAPAAAAPSNPAAAPTEGTPAAAPAGAAAAETPAAPPPPASPFNSGDTAWLLTSSALVLLMTPGLALFYGGMVRRKNVLGTLMQSFIAMGVVSIIWMVCGYSFGFSEGSPLLGGTKYLFLNGVGANDVSPYFMDRGTGTVPHPLYMIFQMMFAIITPALISGAFAERMRFSAYVLFISLWSLIVYTPIAHWVWGADGWLYKLGALDFAGGTVVHISSGVTALVAALIMGKRKGYPSEEMRPHDLTMTLVGTGLLWFGWFGFNGGSSLAADGLGVSAFVNTHLGAAAAMLGWLLMECIRTKKPSALGAASGAVAGLVGITPAAGFVNPIGAVAIGFITAIACYFACVVIKPKLGYDDSLDTFGVHGIGGTVGALLTGVFAVKTFANVGANGLLAGDSSLLMKQLIGVGATWLYAGVVSAILLVVVNAVCKLRVKSDSEEDGLDLTQHGEEAYAM